MKVNSANQKVMDKLNRDINKITKSLHEKHKGVKRVVNKFLVKEGNELRNIIITSMRDTPRSPSFRRGGKNRTIIHHPSIKGNPPAIDTGELVRSILYDVEDMKLNIGTIAGGAQTKGGRNYGEILETTKHLPLKRPWLEPAVLSREKEIKKTLKDILKKEFGRL